MRPKIGGFSSDRAKDRTLSEDKSIYVVYQIRLPPVTTIKMNSLLRGVLGTTGTVMLLHAGYSAFESLTYEKSLDPSSPLDIPLDVRTR